MYFCHPLSGLEATTCPILLSSDRLAIRALKTLTVITLINVDWVVYVEHSTTCGIVLTTATKKTRDGCSSIVCEIPSLGE